MLIPFENIILSSPFFPFTKNSLDFLRKSRELSDWYGPAFYFVANPLMISFAPIKAMETLNMTSYVRYDQSCLLYFIDSIFHVLLGERIGRKYPTWSNGIAS